MSNYTYSLLLLKFFVLFIRANIDDITGAQRVVLLTKSTTTNKPTLEDDCCHIKLNTGLQHSTPLTSLLCDCNKIELFAGVSEEYINVFYGELLDEFDGAKSYIFEFKFPKNVSELLLKVCTFMSIAQSSTYLKHFHFYYVVYYKRRTNLDLWCTHVSDRNAIKLLSTVYKY